MTNKKGLHIFEKGELVIPHPIIYLVYKDIEEGDYGIVVDVIKQSHPLRDFRKVKVYWQRSMEEETYYAHMVYHLHHEYVVEEITQTWKEELNKHPLSSLHMYNSRLFSEKFPMRNPCKKMKKIQ